LEQLGHDDSRALDEVEDVCEPGAAVQMTVAIPPFTAEGLFCTLLIVERIVTGWEIV
jgi:hypothetical protein